MRLTISRRYVAASLLFLLFFMGSQALALENSKDQSKKADQVKNTNIPATTQKEKATSTVLDVIEENITVNGKSSRVFNIVQSNGTEGYEGIKGEPFNVLLENKTSVPLTIHWHGLICPNKEDGVAYITQLPIPPGGKQLYNFKLVQSGTYWMHAHYKLQEQKLMAAPLIIKDPHDPYLVDKDVVMMLEDFSFTNPQQLFLQLRKNLTANMSSKQSTDMNKPNMPEMTKEMQNKIYGTLPASMSTTDQSMDMNKLDLTDVKFDAYLANRRTLQDSEVIRVSPKQVIRLRIINGSASSNFWVYTGNLMGRAVAIDGQYIKPYANNKFQLGLGNRMDIIVTIPRKSGVYPILAQAEGTDMQTGIILATSTAKILDYDEIAKTSAPPLTYDQEVELQAAKPLSAKNIDNTLNFILQGNMQNYVWTINNQVWPLITPMLIKQGQRIAMVFNNQTNMAHPMHLHGHVFQIVEINGQPVKDGALHDTILVMPHSTLRVVFDADNPGIWLMHCHVLYHLAGGMATTINYVGYAQPDFYQNLIKKKKFNFSLF